MRKRTLTIQSGNYANWVGSHYWSALQHDTDMPESEYDIHYNESRSGVLKPRLMFIDYTDNLGSVPVDADEPLTEQIVERIDQDMTAPGIHPLRQSIIDGQPNVSGLINPESFNYWTDFFELPSIPSEHLLLPTGLKPTNSQFKYWFQYDRFSADKIDESPLRLVVEETDLSVHSIRLLSDIDSSISEYSISISEYLKSCYPKSESLIPVSGLPRECMHDDAIPSLVNLAFFINNETAINEGERNSLFTLFTQRDSLLTDSALEAVWLDSISIRSTTSNPVMIETPYLSIRGHQHYPLPHGSGGLLNPTKRQYPFHPNIGNPCIRELQPDIVAGTNSQSSTNPILKCMQHAISRFERDFRAVWEPCSDRIEKDDWMDIKETITSILKSDE